MPFRPAPQEPMKVAEKMPEFKGGKQAMFTYLVNELKYPAAAKADEAAGTVFVGFVVDADGHVRDAQVKRGVHKALDAEALRVVKGMPGLGSRHAQRQDGAGGDDPLPIRFDLPRRNRPATAGRTKGAPSGAPFMFTGCVSVLALLLAQGGAHHLLACCSRSSSMQVYCSSESGLQLGIAGIAQSPGLLLHAFLLGLPGGAHGLHLLGKAQVDLGHLLGLDVVQLQLLLHARGVHLGTLLRRLAFAFAMAVSVLGGGGDGRGQQQGQRQGGSQHLDQWSFRVGSGGRTRTVPEGSIRGTKGQRPLGACAGGTRTSDGGCWACWSWAARSRSPFAKQRLEERIGLAVQEALEDAGMGPTAFPMVPCAWTSSTGPWPSMSWRCTWTPRGPMPCTNRGSCRTAWPSSACGAWSAHPPLASWCATSCRSAPCCWRNRTSWCTSSGGGHRGRRDVGFRLGMLYELIAGRLAALGIAEFELLRGELRLEEIAEESTR